MFDPVAPSFSEYRLRFSAKSLREEVTDNQSTSTYVRDGDLEIHVRPEVNQAHVFRTGDYQVSALNIFDVRYLPNRIKFSQSHAEATKDGNVKILMPSKQYYLIADVDSGLVYEEFQHIERANLTSIILQKGPLESALPIILPSVSCRCTFIAKKLHDIELVVITHVSLNQPVPEESFKASVSQGMKVLDHRDNPDHPIIRVQRKATEDLRSELPPIGTFRWSRKDKSTQ